jgi:hypothetical protein
MSNLTYDAKGRPVTRTGLIIGGAYTPPPARMGSHAIAIQGLLLRKGKGKMPSKPARGSLAPRCGLPTLTPTTLVGRVVAWVLSKFNL